MGREIYNIINDMAEVLNASQMQRLQEVLVKRLSENATSEHSQTTNVEFLDMFLTAKHLFFALNGIELRYTQKELYEMPLLRKGNGTGIYQKPATDFLE